MKKITRANLRGKPLIKDLCYKTKISKHEYGLKDNRQYCYGMINKQTDELFEECKKCKAHVHYVTPLGEIYE